MADPGQSLFQENGLRLNLKAPHAEEEDEAEADRLRRDAEVGKNLNRVFDDLEPDENDTLDPRESSLFETPYHNGIGGGGGVEPRFNDEIQRLQHALQAKGNEVNHLHELLKANETKVSDLNKRLMIAEAEKERAHVTRQQTHDLLIEAKTKVSELESHEDQLKTRIRTLETRNTELTADLESTKTMLSDEQQKYHMLEHSSGQRAENRADQVMRQLKEHHNAQIAMMQERIDGLSAKLEDKEQEWKNLEARFRELQRSKDAMVIEKSDTINRLAGQLDEAQAKLVTAPTLVAENARLQSLVGRLEQQTTEKQRAIDSLTSKLQSTNRELEALESIIVTDGDDSIRPFSHTRRNIPASTPLPVNERLGHLREELARALESQRSKREEIKHLEEQLRQKADEIKRLKDAENHSRAEITRLRDDNALLKQRQAPRRRHSTDNHEKSFLDEMHDEVFTLRAHNDALKAELEEAGRRREEAERELREIRAGPDVELEKIRFQLDDARTECQKVKNQYIKMSGEKDALIREMNKLQSLDLFKELASEKEKVASLERALKIAEMKCSEVSKLLETEKMEREREVKEIQEKFSKEKLNLTTKSDANKSGHCMKCIDYQAEIRKCEIENIQLQHTSSNYLKELSEVRTELTKAGEIIEDLHQKLDLKSKHDQLILELKETAKHFEEYMQSKSNSNSSRDASTSPIRNQRRDASVSTSPERPPPPPPPSSDRSETQIREEMAKLFAEQIKSVEREFKDRLERYNGTVDHLRNSIAEKTRALGVRGQEVEMLKIALLDEREKFHELLAQQKEGGAKQVLDKQTEILRKCRVELENYQERIQRLTTELGEKSEAIEAERESMEALRKQIGAERQSFRQRETELLDKMHEIQTDAKRSLDVLREKNASLKKTVQNYKQYVEDREKFMEKENERLKEGYKNATAKLNKRLQEMIEERERKFREKLRAVEKDYEAKLAQHSKTR